jgi:hypothetical protein
VGTSFGTIDFAIMPTNTSFLFCFANIKKHDVYLNSTRDVLVHNGKNYPIVMKNGHPWFLLDDLEGIVLHLTKVELRQLHRRFGHPAANRLQQFLTKAGIEDIDRSVLKKINRICHQCQMHSGKPGRFRFTLRENADFNHRFIVDIMFIEGKPVLYAVDEATAFQAARFLSNILAKTTWDTLRSMWIDTYIGPPDVIVINAGTNLKAEEFV